MTPLLPVEGEAERHQSQPSHSPVVTFGTSMARAELVLLQRERSSSGPSRL